MKNIGLKTRILALFGFLCATIAGVLLTACSDMYFFGDMFSDIDALWSGGDQWFLYTAWLDTTTYLDIILFVACALMLLIPMRKGGEKMIDAPKTLRWLVIGNATMVVIIIILGQFLVMLIGNEQPRTEWIVYEIALAWRNVSGLMGLPMMAVTGWLFLRGKKKAKTLSTMTINIETKA